MKSFKDFIAEEKQGTYASLLLSDKSKQDIFDLIQQLKIEKPIDPVEYHVTVLYSRQPVALNAKDFVLPTNIPISGWEVFPTRDQKLCLVMTLKSPAIDDIHSKMIAAGGTHDYPDFKTHISVCMDYQQTVLPTTLPNISVSFSKLEIKPLDLDYKPKEKE